MADALPLGVRRIHLEGLVPTAPAVPMAFVSRVEVAPVGAGIDVTVGDVPAPSRRGDKLREAAAPASARPLEPLMAADFTPGLLALLETYPVIADRREIDLHLAEFGNSNPFVWDWWPAL
jgi:hypothetical protein